MQDNSNRHSSWQHTLKNAIHCAGVGLHSGVRTKMTLRPGAVDSGIVFRLSDGETPGREVSASWQNARPTTDRRPMMRARCPTLLPTILSLAMAATPATGDNWPHWRGPSRDGASADGCAGRGGTRTHRRPVACGNAGGRWQPRRHYDGGGRPGFRSAPEQHSLLLRC